MEMEYEIIFAEEEKTPHETKQLLVIQPTNNNNLSDFGNGFLKGLWLVVKYSLMFFFVVLGISLLFL